MSRNACRWEAHRSLVTLLLSQKCIQDPGVLSFQNPQQSSLCYCRRESSLWVVCAALRKCGNQQICSRSFQEGRKRHTLIDTAATKWFTVDYSPWSVSVNNATLLSLLATIHHMPSQDYFIKLSTIKITLWSHEGCEDLIWRLFLSCAFSLFYKEVCKYNQDIKWIIKILLEYITYDANHSICLLCVYHE